MKICPDHCWPIAELCSISQPKFHKRARNFTLVISGMLWTSGTIFYQKVGYNDPPTIPVLRISFSSPNDLTPALFLNIVSSCSYLPSPIPFSINYTFQTSLAKNLDDSLIMWPANVIFLFIIFYHSLFLTIFFGYTLSPAYFQNSPLVPHFKSMKFFFYYFAVSPCFASISYYLEDEGF